MVSIVTMKSEMGHCLKAHLPWRPLTSTNLEWEIHLNKASTFDGKSPCSNWGLFIKSWIYHSS